MIKYCKKNYNKYNKNQQIYGNKLRIKKHKISETKELENDSP